MVSGAICLLSEPMFKTTEDEISVDSEAFCAHCSQAEAERDEARAERDQGIAELSSLQHAFKEMEAAKNRAEDELGRWKHAAVAAAPLVSLIAPCINGE
jgi:hypothetical protein